jgi:hypothetical protein
MREPCIDVMQVAGITFDLKEIRRHVEAIRASDHPGGFIILVNVNDEDTAIDGLPVGVAKVLGEDELAG